MKRLPSGAVRAAACAMLFASAVLPAMAQNPNPEEVSDADRAFIQAAVKANNMEIAEARAHMSSSDQSVHMFAERMIQDHQLAGTQVRALAKQYNVTFDPNAGMTAPSGASAQQYMKDEVSDHQQTIALYQKEANAGTNQPLKTYAASTLPTLQKHLKMAQEYVSSGHITPEPQATPGASSP